MKALILITLFISNSLFAIDKAVPKKDASSTNGGIVINESLQKLMDVPGVKEIYDTCKTQNDEKSYSDANVRAQKVLTCLWKDVQTKPDIKKKVETAYAEESKPKITADAGRAPASAPKEKADVVTKKTVITEDYEKNPSVIALSKFYGDKLDEILNPSKADEKANLIMEIDHKKFIDLYKSELGKTIINAFTSYCIDTDPETCGKCDAQGNCKYECTIKNSEVDRAKDRKVNLDDLAKVKLDSASPDGVKWGKCIMSVAKHCEDANTKNEIEKQSETTKRSCLIVDYVASARKNILIADKQQKFYEDLQKDRTTEIVTNSKAIDPKKASSDEILKVSSKDIEVNMEKPMAADKASFEACYKNEAIVNAEACKKFLSVDKDKNESAIAELGIREMAQEGILETNLNASDKNVADYLKEEGYSSADIEKMTSNSKTINDTKEEILKRYRNEKAAIIAKMAEKITDKTATKEGKIDNSDIGKLEKISKELNSRTTDLAGLVKFNNIVSSYLQVDTGKEIGRNTASLFGELKGMKPDDAKVLQKQMSDAHISEPKTDAQGESTVNLNVDTINQKFLNYSTLPAEPKK